MAMERGTLPQFMSISHFNEHRYNFDLKDETLFDLTKIETLIKKSWEASKLSNAKSPKTMPIHMLKIPFILISIELNLIPFSIKQIDFFGKK